MSYPILLAQLGTFGTLAGVMRLRRRRCFTVATLCMVLTAVLGLLGLGLGLGLGLREPAVG